MPATFITVTINILHTCIDLIIHYCYIYGKAIANASGLYQPKGALPVMIKDSTIKRINNTSLLITSTLLILYSIYFLSYIFSSAFLELIVLFIMPFIGAYAYILFKTRWVLCPVVMYIVAYIWFFSQLVSQDGLSVRTIFTSLFWGIFYALFTLLGIAIVSLLQTALGNLEKRKLPIRLVMIITALSFMALLLLATSLFTGDPVSRHYVRKSISVYAHQNYFPLELEVSNLSYDFSYGDYYAEVTSKTNPSIHFVVTYRQGKIFDDYKSIE